MPKAKKEPKPHRKWRIKPITKVKGDGRHTCRQLTNDELDEILESVTK